MTDEQRKLAKERDRARNRAKWAAMTPEQRSEKREQERLRRLYKEDYGGVGLYADGKLSRCGYRWHAHGGHGNASIEERRREVYARMAKIKDGWRKS